MRLSTRFLLLLIFVFSGVILTIWFGVRPTYEEAVISERLVIASEHQREKVARAERIIEFWERANRELQQDLLISGNIDRAELLFSGFSSVFNELKLLRVVEVESGEFIEVRASSGNGLSDMLAPFLSVGAMAEYLGEYTGQPLWLPEQDLLIFIAEFDLENQQYMIASVFETHGLHEMLLSHNLGVEARSVVWQQDAEKEPAAVLSEGEPPSYSPAFERIGRAEQREIDGRSTRVISSPISLLSARHAIYIDENSIREPVERIFMQGLWVISIAFIALGAASLWLLSQLSSPIKRFIEDIEPFADFRFDQPFRKTDLPELNQVTVRMEEVRQKLAHYQKINVEQIISNEQRLRLLIEHASDLIAVFDAQGRFIFRNACFGQLFTDLDISTPGTLQEFWELRVIDSVKKKEHKRKQESSLTIESEFQEISIENEREKRSYFFKVQKATVLDEQGECMGGQLMMYDLTQERELDRRRNDMINIIVHELKNPLTGIKGIINMLQQQEMNKAETDEFFGIIERSTDEMFELVQRFLQVSRLESETGRLEKEPLDFARLIRRIVADTKPVLQEKNLDISMQLDESLPPVMAARDLIGDVVRNLISNAIKYGPASRTIEMNLGREAPTNQDREWLVLSITDHGYGIDEEYREHIFKKFYRIKAYKTEQGTGLGLPYVKEIIERHDGHITVESNNKIGSRFTMRIPLHSKPLQTEEAQGGAHDSA